MKVGVLAQTAARADSVVRTLRVEPEGIEKELVYNVLADLTAAGCTAESPCAGSYT